MDSSIPFTLVGLNNAQSVELRTVAISCSKQLREVDAEAANLINSVKSRYRNAPRNSPDSVFPPPPQELSELEVKRTQLVISAADALASSFGPAEFALFRG